MNIKTKLISGIAAAVIITVAAAAAVPGVFGQEGGDSTPDATTQERRADFNARLAAKLGVTPEQLTGAVKDTRLELVDEALAAGRIDEARAEKMRQRIENGGSAIGHQGRHRLAKVRAGIVASAAGAIGVSAEDLRTQLKGGASIAEAASAAGVSVDDVKARISADAQTKLAEGVAAGRIDQARADELLEKLNARLDDIVNKKKKPSAPTG